MPVEKAKENPKNPKNPKSKTPSEDELKILSHGIQNLLSLRKPFNFNSTTTLHFNPLQNTPLHVTEHTYHTTSTVDEGTWQLILQSLPEKHRKDLIALSTAHPSSDSFKPLKISELPTPTQRALRASSTLQTAYKLKQTLNRLPKTSSHTLLESFTAPEVKNTKTNPVPIRKSYSYRDRLHILRRVKRKAEEFGITFIDIANFVGVSTVMVSKWMGGRFFPSAQNTELLRLFLEMPVFGVSGEFEDAVEPLSMKQLRLQDLETPYPGETPLPNEEDVTPNYRPRDYDPYFHLKRSRGGRPCRKK